MAESNRIVVDRHIREVVGRIGPSVAIVNNGKDTKYLDVPILKINGYALKPGQSFVIKSPVFELIPMNLQGIPTSGSGPVCLTQPFSHPSESIPQSRGVPKHGR